MNIPGISDLALYTRGKRGLIYVGMYRGKKVAVKTINPASKAFGSIAREGTWLEKLNRYEIGPRLVFRREDYFVYEFVEGDLLPEYIRISSVKDVKRVLNEVLKQCRVLDTLCINKEEMHNPFKHIIVGTTVVMIDFERCRTTLTPQNVTQFVQYICYGLKKTLDGKKIVLDCLKLQDLAKEYKLRYSQIVCERIVHELQ